MPETGGKRRGLVMSAVAALVIAAIFVLLRQRNVPDLLVQSDEGWQPQVQAAIGGEVVTPGTYTLRGDARLSDLVTAAGGYTAMAERSALNPAARISDGMEYIIPTLTTRAVSSPARATASASTTAAVSGTTAPSASAAVASRQTTKRGATPGPGRVNINTATKAELEALPAIGPAIAQRIIDDRTANGPYTQIEDLARVRGISAKTVDQLRERITVAP
ncbi:MAG: ComEA family DNA-binding protein [Thermomicrobia bacterium]|nr:ComEA family DNA-binding protein [Thermomicrobia bacterium]